MIVAIIGSTKFNDYLFLEKRTVLIIESLRDVEIISGGAPGADTLGKLFSQEHDYKFTLYPPAFKKYGTPYRKADYYDRDILMARDCDICLGFLVRITGENKGSMYTINEAIRLRKEVHVYYREVK